jgi:nicotinate-nucleotide pyrophosphorylase (carboxylating)
MVQPAIPPPPSHDVDRVLRAALAEDLGEDGDRTTCALVPDGQQARATVMAEEALVLAGIDCALRTFTLLDPKVRRCGGAADGQEVGAGTAVLEVEGSARALLTGERTALNLLGRLCGIATATRAVTRRVAGTGSSIFDTRKTTPGLRHLEKYAVRCGGGSNHRMGLHDMALIKENHIAMVGSVADAVRRVRENLPRQVPVQVEVSDLAELEQALEAGADLILMDNADVDTVEQAVKKVGGRIPVEASGGISPDQAEVLARRTGVPRISMGLLTRGAVWCDLSMDLVLASADG